MVPIRLFFAILAVLPLGGCEMLTGDKGKDGESVGYACRVSSKLPEDCMKENAAYTPTSILTGWKAADAHLTGGKADAHAGDAPPADDGAKPEGETKEGGEAKPEGEAPAGEAKPAPEENKH